MAAVAWMPNQPEANVAFRPGHPAFYFSPLCGLPALREEGSRLSSSHRPDSFVSSAQMLFTALPQAETMVLLGYSFAFARAAHEPSSCVLWPGPPFCSAGPCVPGSQFS